MLTGLDLLVLVFMVLGAISLVSVALMFLVRNRIVQKVCFYHVLTLAAYLGYVGIAIGGGLFPFQAGLGAFLILAAVAALVLELTLGRKNKAVFLVLRIAAAASLLVGLLNAIM